MNKLLIALIAGSFATVAMAQSAATKEKQKDVSNITQGAVDQGSSTNTAAQQKANTAVSKETAKMSKEDKSKFAKDAMKTQANPNNSASSATTAAEQKANTAASKAVPKQSAQFKTKEGKKELSKDLQQKAGQ